MNIFKDGGDAIVSFLSEPRCPKLLTQLRSPRNLAFVWKWPWAWTAQHRLERLWHETGPAPSCYFWESWNADQCSASFEIGGSVTTWTLRYCSRLFPSPSWVTFNSLVKAALWLPLVSTAWGPSCSSPDRSLVGSFSQEVVNFSWKLQGSYCLVAVGIPEIWWNSLSTGWC